MRATSLPAALHVAAAAIPLVAAALVPLAAPSTALAERWLRPVPGEVARSFDYASATPFARGAHRGADLAAPPGTTVGAACGGRVIHAGPVAGRGAVSVRCGGRRVSYLPLSVVAVRSGAIVRAGQRIGAVARGHGGLHVGVRRERDRFAYEDPMTLLAASGPPGVPVAAPRPSPPRRIVWPRASPSRRIVWPRASPPRPIAPPQQRPAPRLRPHPTGPRHPAVRHPALRVPSLSSRPAVRARLPGHDLAPWPVWGGLAMLLCGATGSGAVALRRRRRVALRALVSSRA